MNIYLTPPYSMRTEHALSRFQYGDVEFDDLKAGSGIEVMVIDLDEPRLDTRGDFEQDLWESYRTTNVDTWVGYSVMLPATSDQYLIGPFHANLRDFTREQAEHIIGQCIKAYEQRAAARELWGDAWLAARSTVAEQG